MGVTQKFALVPVHAHIPLLGWASLALAGLVYHLDPAACETRLARLHFWLHNIALPVFMAGLGFMLTGSEGVVPLVVIAAIAVLLGLALFAANVLLNIESARQASEGA